MTVIASRISKELIGLPAEEQAAILSEVKERLGDLRAKKTYDSYLSGNSKAGRSGFAPPEDFLLSAPPNAPEMTPEFVRQILE